MTNTALYVQLAAWSQIAGSVIFIAGLVYVFRRFVIPAVATSQERKNAELAEAEHRRDAARDDARAAQADLAMAAQDATAIADRADRDAARERERIVAEASAEGERLVRNAEGELERSRYAARALLREELIDKAVAVAREAAGRLDADRNAGIISSVLGGIGSTEAHG